MPVDTSRNSNSESRHQRAKAMMTQQSAGSESGATAQQPTNSPRSRLATESTGKPGRAPKRSDGSRIDKVLAAISGRETAGAAESGPEAGQNVGRDDDQLGLDSPPPPSSQRDQQRPAFDLDDDDDVEAEEKPRKRVRAKTLGEFADELEIEPKAIYDLALTVKDGETPVTIGQLKDHFKATKDFERTSQEFEDYRVQSQNEIIKGRNELDGVLERIAAVVPRKDMENILVGVRDQAAQAKASCQKELREYFPEWDDDDVRRKAGKKMAGWLVSYGIPAEVLGNLYDAKIIRMLWHMGNKAERYQTLKEGQREKRPSVEPKSSRRKPAPTPTETARDRTLKGDKVGAVAALLTGKSNGYDKSR